MKGSKKKKGGKRGRKNIKNKGPELPDPNIRHEREGNTNFFSEEVAKELFEKILSLTLTEYFRRQADSKIGDICFRHMKQELTNYLQMQFIPHERDDMPYMAEKLVISKPPSFIEGKYAISQISSENDKEESILGKVANLIPSNWNTSVFYDAHFEKDNFWGEVPCPNATTKDRYASTQIGTQKFNPDEETKEENEQIQPTQRKLTEKSSSRYTFYKKVSKNEFNSSKVDMGLKKRAFAYSFESFDIPKDKLPKKIELPEISKLREERELKIKQIKEEREKELLKEKQEKENEKLIFGTNNAKKQKKKKITNFTVDSEGKIVVIKPLPIETLHGEFTSAKTDLKEINVIKDMVNINSGEQDNNTNPKKAETKNPVVEYNPNKGDKGVFFLNASKVASFKGVKPLPPEFLGKDKKTETITPCGSNFNIMKPEIGVTIIEDTKMKTGGKDFFSKFNKFSLNNFNKTLRETLMQQSMKNVFENPIKDYNQSKSKTFYGTENNKEPSYPPNSFRMNQDTSMNQNNSGQYHSSISAIENKTMAKSHSASNMILQTFKFPSLRVAIEGLDLIEESDEVNQKKKETKYDNLFESYKKLPNVNQKMMRNSSVEDLREMNKFTKSLLSSNSWGMISRKKTAQQPRYPKKPEQKEIEKEMGMNITMTKLPRARVKEMAKNLIKKASGPEPLPKKYPEKNFFQVD